MISRLLSAFGASILLFGIATISDAALVGRLPTTPGDTDYQAAYDTELGITWLVGDGTETTQPFLSWEDSLVWADNFSLGGHNDWRLPNMDVNGDTVVETCSTGVVCTDNELGHFYHFNLGGSGESRTGFQVVDDITFGVFIYYWSSNEYPPLTPWAWIFWFGDGAANNAFRTDSLIPAWAVTDGDPFAPVPLPPALWLFGSGLLGMIGIARRKK